MNRKQAENVAKKKLDNLMKESKIRDREDPDSFTIASLPPTGKHDKSPLKVNTLYLTHTAYMSLLISKKCYQFTHCKKKKNMFYTLQLCFTHCKKKNYLLSIFVLFSDSTEKYFVLF